MQNTPPPQTLPDNSYLGPALDRPAPRVHSKYKSTALIFKRQPTTSTCYPLPAYMEADIPVLYPGRRHTLSCAISHNLCNNRLLPENTPHSLALSYHACHTDPHDDATSHRPSRGCQASYLNTLHIPENQSLRVIRLRRKVADL